MTISGKRYRLKSESRFTLFMVLMIILLVMSVNSFLGFYSAKSFTEQQYIEVEIMYGDTLWDIAKTYMADYDDTRKSVYMLAQLNDISPNELKEGQVLLVPVYK